MKKQTSIIIVLMLFIFGATFATADIGPVVNAHTPDVTITPNVANCNDIPSEFNVNVANIGAVNVSYGIYNVKIYKAQTNIVDLTCGAAPAGWTSTGNGTLVYGLYCEYTTDPEGLDVIDAGESIDFTFDAVLGQDAESCGSTFRITTLDNEAIITGSGEGSEQNTNRDLKVDCSNPTLVKTVGNPKIIGNGFDWWITQDTPIDFVASDSLEQDQCNLGIDYCEYTIILDPNSVNEEDKTSQYCDKYGDTMFGDWCRVQNGNSLEWTWTFDEDSNHHINVNCYDKAGNRVNPDEPVDLYEHDKVDSTVPITTLTYVGPYYTDGVAEWIDGVSTINLDTVDPDPTGESCNIGVDNTYYKYTISEDESLCSDVAICNDRKPSSYRDEDWSLYTGSIATGEESCHIIEYYSNDTIGNTEEVQWDCVYVDTTHPVINKTIVGNQAGVCPPAPNSNDECFIESSTDINLFCNDGGPHPSQGETIFWKYQYTEDGENWTAGTPNCVTNDEGYCVVEGTETTISFNESSLHELTWYCEDNVEKKSDVDVELFRVDNEAPIITKEVIGPQVGICPPAPNSDDECFVKQGETIIRVDAVDPNPIHASNQVICEWSYEWQDEPYGPYSVKEFPFDIVFEEDSSHLLTIECYDRLDHDAVDVEMFLVDGLPPETKKSYGEPYYTGGFPKICDLSDNIGPDANTAILCGWAQWITSETPVTLEAFDAKSGVDKIMWRNLLVTNDTAGNDICGHMPMDYATSDLIVDATVCATDDFDCMRDYCNPEYYNEFVDLDTVWNEYNESFYKPEDSCHVIEYKSVDNLGNEEMLNWQCVFVDNLAPEMTKEIGEPHVEMCTMEPTTGPNTNVLETDAESFFFTLGNVIFFGYTDNTALELYDSSDVLVWSGTINEGDMQNVDVPEGVYRSTGNEKYSVLVGDPLVNGCNGYYALDDEGLGASTDVYTHTSKPVCHTKFMIFSYDDNNNYEIRDASDTLVNSGTLSADGNYEMSSSPGRQLHVTSDFPVTVLTVNDQGYFIPGADGLFSGDYFLTYVAGGNYMDLNAYAYYDDTLVTFKNTVTDAVLATTTLAKGESLSWTASSDTFVTVESDKDVSASVQPFASRATGYHQGGYAGDRDGSGIGLEFMVPAWTGTTGYVMVFAYADNTVVNVYNAGTDALLSTHNLDKGDSVNVQAGHFIHQVTATKGVSIYTGYGYASASFAPVAFGENACLDADSDGICDPVDNCPDDYNPDQEYICGEGEVEVCADYITTETPITFTCGDQMPHPVDHVEMNYRYRFSDDCVDFGNWTEWISPENVSYSEDFYEVSSTIFFKEDSCHELEYYCEDGLGNTGPVMSELDIVDTQSPVIDLEVTGPQIGCDGEYGMDECQIDGVTLVNIDVVDPQPHPVNDVTCEWYYTVYEDWEQADEGVPNFTSETFQENDSWVINFPEESHHNLFVTCKDALGNTVDDEYWFTVDKTKPVTTSGFGKPSYTNDLATWINFQTPVYLEATDAEGPHDSGIDATYFRWSMVADEFCENQRICQDAPSSDEDFMTYDESFVIDEESCHLIEYYSVDGVDKTEDVNKECVYVDHTAPTANKTVGMPASMLSNEDYTWKYFPEVNGNCWTNENGSIDCWDVTKMTPIDMSCVDQDPHPVGESNVCFQVWVDGYNVSQGDDKTEEYCEQYEGDYDKNNDGYCCTMDEIKYFTFEETSEHNLAFYCEDALGNRGEIDDEKFKVYETAFEIPLNDKWNLISVPVNLLDNSMDELFAPIADQVLGVYQFDGQEWHIFTPDNNPLNDDITTMESGWGYWVLMDGEATLTIGGGLISGGLSEYPTVPIYHGWNLIGYIGAVDMNGEKVLSYDGPASFDSPVGKNAPIYCKMATLRSSVFDTVTPSMSTWWEPYNTDGIDSTYPSVPLNSLSGRDMMDPGAGYWMFYSGDTSDEPALYSWVPETSCEQFLLRG